ncbi:HAD-IB family phosphatase [candidate division KSB1 bacterium]|nr:HAD-IB family phosphatase [candidate division KSB1 bacterium]
MDSITGERTEMSKLDIVFFDMDYTVLENDCDVLWKNFLADEKIAPESDRERALYYLDLHHRGVLPVAEYTEFQWKEFAGKTPQQMEQLSQRHFEEYVRPFIYPGAVKEIQKYRQQNIPVVILTGTNRVTAAPIAAALDTDLIATDLEIVNGKFTGKLAGRFLIKENKVLMAEEYCRKRLDTSPDRAAFYGDSINDAILLDKVAQATVVNPKNNLLELAKEKNWRVVYWSL